MFKKINPAWLFIIVAVALLPCFSIKSNIGYVFNNMGIGLGYLPVIPSSLISFCSFIHLFSMICFIILLFKNKYNTNMIIVIVTIGFLKILFSIAFALWALSGANYSDLYKIAIPDMIVNILFYIVLISFMIMSVIPKFEKAKTFCKRIWYIPAILNFIGYILSLPASSSLVTGFGHIKSAKRMAYKILLALKREQGILLFFAIIISLIDVIAMLIFSYQLLNCKYPEKKVKLKMKDMKIINHTEMPNIEFLSDAILKAIKPNLKSPLSAILCDAEEFVIRITENNTYIIEGYVNSQNSYGAMIKTDFTVNAQHKNDSWIVEKTAIGVKNAIIYAKNFITNYILISVFVAIIAVIGVLVLSALVNI